MSEGRPIKLNWRRFVAPLILVSGIMICLKESTSIAIGVSLVAFSLILGFSIGSSPKE